MASTINHPITTFTELNSFIINTESFAILAFSEPNSFGQYWLERMEQKVESSAISNLNFRIELPSQRNELSVLTRAGGGPIIFFIRNRKIIAKSMGRVSEYDFMKHLNQIQSITQAA